ncbi:MAG: hypothetical protein CL748_04865 [Chloroflexi bacterium]|nr:hypothetical protein [Chloroflexota bacterium]
MEQDTITLIRDLLIIFFVIFALLLLIISTYLWVKIYKKINKIFNHADNAKSGITDVVESVNTGANLIKNSSFKPLMSVVSFGAILVGISKLFKK